MASCGNPPARVSTRWKLIDKPTRGTEVTLHLREDESELLNEWQLRSIITKYSDHITLPVLMPVQKFSEDKDAPPTIEEERINQAAALWARPKQGEIKEEEYKEFYKHVGHDFEDPLAWTHNRVEGKLEYTSLLFIPARAPFDLWDRDQRHGVKLYVQRVFIMDDAEHLMPRYLRFVRGVIDSNDLPLNISRELLQGSKVVDSIRAGSVKKSWACWKIWRRTMPKNTASSGKSLAGCLRKDPAEDYGNREQIAKLLRFASTHNDNTDQTVSLADYVGRMKDGQDKIYYIVADSFRRRQKQPASGNLPQERAGSAAADRPGG
jgi:molecular chaperone HtpG